MNNFMRKFGLGILVVLVLIGTLFYFFWDKTNTLNVLGNLTIIGNVTFLTPVNYSLCLSGNISYAPLEEFCNDNGMELSRGSLFNDAGCVDKLGEIHYYRIKYNHSTEKWIIGNETYSPKWTCQ